MVRPLSPLLRAAGRTLGPMLYLSLALATTWPLALSVDSRLPLGTEDTRVVPMFNAWTMWWNAEQLSQGNNCWIGSDYWDAPIFYPETSAFAFSEPQPMTWLIAPVIWLTGSLVIAYNVYLWLALTLNGWFAESLLRALGIRPIVAVGGGMAMVLLPVAHYQLGVVQLVPVWAILWVWLAYAKAFCQVPTAEQRSQQSDLKSESESKLRSNSPKVDTIRGIELGIAFTCVFSTSVHHGLFLVLLMVATAWTLGRHWFAKRTWLILSIAALVACVLVGPIAWQIRQATVEHEDFTRPADIVEQLSTQPVDYLATYGHSMFDSITARAKWLMSPGLAKLMLASLGLCMGMFANRHRQWTVFIGALGILAFVLSLGTHCQLYGIEPWQLLVDYVPGFAQVRSAFRFGYFVQMVVIVLAASGIEGLLRCITSRRFGQASQRGAVITVIILGVVAALDPFPRRPMLGVAPNFAKQANWLGYLREFPPGGAALCLPMAGGDSERDFEITTEWMMWGTQHKLPLVNGYSGFFPQSNFEVREAVLNNQLPSHLLERLYGLGVRCIIVDRRRFEFPPLSDYAESSVRVTHVYSEGRDIDLYYLAPAVGQTTVQVMSQALDASVRDAARVPRLTESRRRLRSNDADFRSFND
ncbi:MAG: hypothetical protein R3C53_02485 [Pirellulaceae bacterium]